MRKVHFQLQHFFFVLLATLSSQNIFAQCGTLVWSDEFDETTVDETKWAYDIGNGCDQGLCGWGNSELQSYTNSTNNVRINDGVLEIEARNNNGTYTSAKLTTFGLHSWQYGRFEARIKLAAGTGLWPAFWMLPVSGSWPQTGEIDIMENRGDRMDEVGGTLHYGSSFPYNQNDGTSYHLESGSFADDFHVFACEWEEGEIRWYVDDVLYKTETEDPYTLDPGSSDNLWPWNDQEFYLILNLAIGGENTWYTGTQAADFGTSAVMEIDYVRVYSSAQPDVAIDGETIVFDTDVTTYSVEDATGQSYEWVVPDGAEIISGEGTNEITVDWSDSEGGQLELYITHSSGTCSGNTFFYTLDISVFENICGFIFESFDDPAAMVPGYISGTLTETTNPGTNTVNTSVDVGQYVRNSNEQYDVIIYEEAVLSDAADYTSGELVLKMDVRTDAPVGTTVEVQIGNVEAAGTYPSGVHSNFTATTTVTNEWETLTFSYLSSPDPNGASYSENLDRLVILFNGNSWTDDTYYFDNIRHEIVGDYSELEISGSQTVEEFEEGVEFTVAGLSTGSSVSWSVPEGAEIVSEDGSTVTVNFGEYSGTLSASEVAESGCTAQTEEIAVIVGGNSCSLFAAEFSDGSVDSLITVVGDGDFVFSEVDNNWVINSSGYGEWTHITYDIYDEDGTYSIDFSDSDNAPVLYIRAKASGNAVFAPTLVDGNGVDAANQYLYPVNRLELTTEFQEFEIDFNGQMWNENSSTVLDSTNITQIDFRINPGFISYPYTGTNQTYNSSFLGNIEIDYIRIGEECILSSTKKNVVLESTVEIFPNPANNEVRISNIDLSSISSMEIINGQGESIYTYEEISNELVTLPETMNSGIYYLVINTENGSYVEKLVKL